MRFPLASPSMLALASAVLVAACGKPAGPAAAPPPPEVAVVQVKSEPLPLYAELPGRTSAYLIAEVRPQVGGIVKSREFREGADVKAGAVLYRIDPATYEAELQSATAALARAEASLTSARLKAGRYAELSTIDAVSRQANDDAQAALKLTEADVASATAAVQTARINVRYTSVSAPISGRVGRSTVTPGALVTANQAQALATIQQLDPIYVDLTQSSVELMRLKADIAAGVLKTGPQGEAQVRLLLEDGTPYPLPGKLQFADVTVDPSTGAVTLRAVVPNPKQQLLPGMYVRAVLEEGVRQNAILAPQRGITRDPRGNATALVVNAQNVVERRELQTERAIGDRWLVSKGLVDGDRVIVEGLQRVRPGATVRVAAQGSPQNGAPNAPGAGGTNAQR